MPARSSLCWPRPPAPSRSSASSAAAREHARPEVLHRHRQGRGAQGAGGRRRARAGHRRPRPEPGAGAQPGAAAAVPRRRPQRPDPRHLRPARALLRGQAPGGAGAAAPPVHAAGARLDPPGAAEGRHRPARSGRDPAGDGPALLGKRIAMLRERLARIEVQRAQGGGRGSGRGADGLAGGLHQRRQVDAVQPADDRPACCRPISCSRRWTRRCGGCRCPGRARRCWPTPSASSSQLPHELVAAFRCDARGDPLGGPAAARGRCQPAGARPAHRRRRDGAGGDRCR
jgi:hypothetical protein